MTISEHGSGHRLSRGKVQIVCVPRGGLRVETRRRSVDRRKQPRFEVVGDLWGTLDIVQPLPIVNIGSGGALVEADQAWAIGSVHSVVVANGTEIGEARICIRHVTPSNAEPGGRYQIGVEFLELTPALAEEVSTWLAANGTGIARTSGSE